MAANRYPLSTSAEANAKATRANSRASLASADHVHAKAIAHAAGDREEIIVTVLVDKDYHINANPASFDYLIPTSVSFADVPGVRVSYPEPTLIKPRFAPEGMKVYEGEVTLKAAAPRVAFAQGGAATAELRVQACTDEFCLPPATLPLRIERR